MDQFLVSKKNELIYIWKNWASLVTQIVKNPPANAGDIRDAGSIPGSGRSPGEGNAARSSILAWRIPWTAEPGGLQSTGSQRLRHNWATEHTKRWLESTHVENTEWNLANFEVYIHLRHRKSTPTERSSWAWHTTHTKLFMKVHCKDKRNNSDTDQGTTGRQLAPS